VLRDWVIIGRRLTTKDGARLGGEFVRHVAPAIIKPARTLWNEVIGFIFFCLAVPFAVRCYTFARVADGRWIPLAGVSAFLMFFAVTSFWRARKISRS
jgi:hypothetical protein